MRWSGRTPAPGSSARGPCQCRQDDRDERAGETRQRHRKDHGRAQDQRQVDPAEPQVGRRAASAGCVPKNSCTSACVAPSAMLTVRPSRAKRLRVSRAWLRWRCPPAPRCPLGTARPGRRLPGRPAPCRLSPRERPPSGVMTWATAVSSAAASNSLRLTTPASRPGRSTTYRWRATREASARTRPIASAAVSSGISVNRRDSMSAPAVCSRNRSRRSRCSRCFPGNDRSTRRRASSRMARASATARAGRTGPPDLPARGPESQRTPPGDALPERGPRPPCVRG